MAPRDFPAGGYTGDYLVFWGVWCVLAIATVWFLRRMRRRSPGRTALLAGNGLVLLTLLWTCVLAGETYLRYVYDATDSYGLTLTNFSWFRRHVTNNSQGFRDGEFSRRLEPDTRLVACVGDSFTVGYGVPDVADVWPQRVRRALTARAPRAFEVRNYGLVGLDTGAQLELVAAILAETGTEHVVIAYCLNDIDDLMPSERRFDRHAAPQVPLLPPTFSFLADFLWFRLSLRDDDRVRGYFDWVAAAYDDPATMARQAERFAKMAALCRQHGVRLDVVVFPFFASWRDSYPLDAAHDRVAAAWDACGVHVVDLREAYRGIDGSELVVNRFDAHPNARAHAIAEQTIVAELFGER